MKEKKKKLKQEPVKNITVCCLKRFLSRLTIGSGSETGKVGREEKHAAFAKRMTGVDEMAEGAMQGVVGRIGGEIAVVTSVHEEKTGPFRFLDGEQINFSHQTGQIGVDSPASSSFIPPPAGIWRLGTQSSAEKTGKYSVSGSVSRRKISARPVAG